MPRPRSAPPPDWPAALLGVIPPEVPAATGRHVVISRGFLGASMPSSVAQVSAPAADSAPRKPPPPRCRPSMMHSVATPPLASTCHASRCAPLACASEPHCLRRVPTRDSTLELLKKAQSAQPLADRPVRKRDSSDNGGSNRPVRGQRPALVRGLRRHRCRARQPAASAATLVGPARQIARFDQLEQRLAALIGRVSQLSVRARGRRELTSWSSTTNSPFG